VCVCVCVCVCVIVCECTHMHTRSITSALTHQILTQTLQCTQCCNSVYEYLLAGRAVRACRCACTAPVFDCFTAWGRFVTLVGLLGISKAISVIVRYRRIIRNARCKPNQQSDLKAINIPLAALSSQDIATRSITLQLLRSLVLDAVRHSKVAPSLTPQSPHWSQYPHSQRAVQLLCGSSALADSGSYLLS
jgi:hypothetical protein